MSVDAVALWLGRALLAIGALAGALFAVGWALDWTWRRLSQTARAALWVAGAFHRERGLRRALEVAESGDAGLAARILRGLLETRRPWRGWNRNAKAKR